jgi:hypothetical protein
MRPQKVVGKPLRWSKFHLWMQSTHFNVRILPRRRRSAKLYSLIAARWRGADAEAFLWVDDRTLGAAVMRIWATLCSQSEELNPQCSTRADFSAATQWSGACFGYALHGLDYYMSARTINTAMDIYFPGLRNKHLVKNRVLEPLESQVGQLAKYFDPCHLVSHSAGRSALEDRSRRAGHGAWIVESIHPTVRSYVDRSTANKAAQSSSQQPQREK